MLRALCFMQSLEAKVIYRPFSRFISDRFGGRETHPV